MARARLSAEEEALVTGLQNLRAATGCTLRDLAGAFGLPIETLRGLLYRKNRPGPATLQTLLASSREAVDQESDPYLRAAYGGIFDRVCDIKETSQRSLPQDDRCDRLYRRIVDDFASSDRLLRFLGVEDEEWHRFAEGGPPSRTLLQATVQAYRAEAERVGREDPEDVKWCKETAAAAEEVLRRM